MTKEQTTLFDAIDSAEANKEMTIRPDEWNELLFPVECVEVFTNDFEVASVCKDESQELDKLGMTVNDFHKAIVNLNTKEVLSIVKNTYHPVSNIDVIEHFEKLLRDEGVKFEYGFATTARNGRKTVFELILPDMTIDLGNGDTQELRLYVQNSFDGGNAIRLDMGFFRHACSNMALMVGNADVNYKTSHIGDATDRIKTTFDLYITQKFNDAKNFCEGLSHKFFDSVDDVIKLIEDEENKIVANKYRQLVIDSWINNYNSGMSLWAVYNAYTHIITHEMRGTEIGKMDKLLKLSQKFNELLKSK